LQPFVAYATKDCLRAQTENRKRQDFHSLLFLRSARNHPVPMRLGYLYSRYPVLSQTFCDAEMLALERFGFDLEIGSVYPPLTSLRHEHIAGLRAPIHYAPPQEILKIQEKSAKMDGKWPRDLVDRHEQKYGPSVKAAQRARNALYFAGHFKRRGVDHVHVHFANRAAHTALFLKEISGIPFSVTAHGQDFMKDLGNDDLLREICAAAEFVAAETDYSRDLLRQRCPDSRIHRVYNGMDLTRFPSASTQRGDYRSPNEMLRIISIGRLVAFKGFENLIDACAELARRGLDFTCEIIGDGPLRSDLEARVSKLNLSDRVHLLGSLTQEAVLTKLRAADIFALASVTDPQGASDVFPTVIIEAMAAARPVVSTRLAGIPESVVHGETGLLVPPGDTTALAEALSRLIQDAKLRLHYGRAGRARIEQHFQIEHTVAPLIELLQKKPGATTKPTQYRASQSEAATEIAYLIDRWPDRDLPLLERELEEMKRRNVPILPIVCELNSRARYTRAMEEMAPSLEFLPDPVVIEAEWRANRGLAQKLEEDRAQQTVRAPSAIFLRQARFALVLTKLLREKNVSHVHATSSSSLVCALMLKKLLNVTVSATIEARPALSRDWIQNALSKCAGGRLKDRQLVRSDSFLVDKTTFRSGPQRVVGLVGQKSGIDLTAGRRFWQEWAGLLMGWGGSKRNSKVANSK
jgi:glycosyltransferase involved in cell wall biosynthesis